MGHLPKPGGWTFSFPRLSPQKTAARTWGTRAFPLVGEEQGQEKEQEQEQEQEQEGDRND
jgi:hypothetical protein